MSGTATIKIQGVGEIQNVPVKQLLNGHYFMPNFSIVDFKPSKNQSRKAKESQKA